MVGWFVRILQHLDSPHRGERSTQVTMHGFELLDTREVQHQLVALDL
jgi:hypothetical protein